MSYTNLTPTVTSGLTYPNAFLKLIVPIAKVQFYHYNLFNNIANCN